MRSFEEEVDCLRWRMRDMFDRFERLDEILRDFAQAATLARCYDRESWRAGLADDRAVQTKPRTLGSSRFALPRLSRVTAHDRVPVRSRPGAGSLR